MKIVINGASGFLGKKLTKHFTDQGHDIIKVSRKHFKLNIHSFKELFRETDVLINLAGTPIVKRWTRSYTKKIYSSRIDTTKKIITAFTLLKDRPGLFISASGTGIYQSNFNPHTEESKDFNNDNVSKLVEDWEEAISGVNNLVDVRLIIMRLSVIFDRNGGAFKKLLRPYYLGMGGRIGNGKQYFPLIHIDDVISSIDFFIENKTSSGIYNLSIPTPITNKELSKAIGKIFKVPSFMITPAFILKLIYGKGANALINGANVVPQKLTQSGFIFKYPNIESLLLGLKKS